MQQISQPGLAHPVIEVRCIAAIYQQHICRPDQGTHRSAPMVGSAVSSRTPSDAQPRPEKYRKSGSAATSPRTDAGPHMGWPHCAVGTTSAWHSATGLPRSSTSAEWMLGLVTPPEVSKSFK